MLELNGCMNLKELKKLEPVAAWTAENKKHMAWIERWLGSNTGNNRVIQEADNSDSDLIDDDDSNYDVGNSQIYVVGAGIEGVNGVYNENGQFDSVKKYTKNGDWKGKEHVFSLFRCRLSDNTQRWYISIVPNNLAPGTNKDIDFYYVTAHGGALEIPHSYKWTTVREHATDPAPISSRFEDGDPITDEGEGEGDHMMGYI